MDKSFNRKNQFSTRLVFTFSSILFFWTISASGQGGRYWDQNLNSEAALLSGAVVAGESSIAAIFYNPATIRRAFKNGDRIMVGDQTGFIKEQEILVTHMRTVKNEEIVIPNSVLMNSNITNYSTRLRENMLIIHTTVGIG